MNRITIFIGVLLLASCSSKDNLSDAYGNFEAVETIVSSEGNGKLLSFTINEGDVVEKGQLIGIIDTTQLYLKQQQLILSIAAIKAKMVNIKPQIEVLLEQKQNLERELNRFRKLKEDGAATQKQLDDLQGEMGVVDSKIVATKTQLNTQNSGIYSEIAPLEVQIAQVNDLLRRSYITSPINGTVLSKYSQQGELAAQGKPLFKLADLSVLELRAYISGGQLEQVEIGKEVVVYIDNSSDEQKKYSGKVTWISSKAEFTPKIVQTKEERVNLVYALKIAVVNDGALKIGMPGEVLFHEVEMNTSHE
ncbi:MAG: HlyD family efflux transporter periplasmic adaptor subunit [Cyclobacteriaceae bacterium]|nr:HlyD family efflux transporter periplasmic adaptor subunit [Cyclobacteriaceae bacterium]